MFSLDISDLYRVHINSTILFPFQPSMMKKNQEPRTKIKKLGTQNVERGTRNTERGTRNVFTFPKYLQSLLENVHTRVYVPSLLSVREYRLKEPGMLPER